MNKIITINDTLPDVIINVLNDTGLSNISHQPHKSKWTEDELKLIRNLLSREATLPEIKQFFTLRSKGAIIKRAQTLGYRRESNSDSIIEFKHGIKSRNRRTKDELITTSLVSVVEENCEECSTAIIPITTDLDKLNMASVKLLEALTLVNEVKSNV